ncbi:hypothetical protein E2C01_014343 [Portunus trituberculatus]|uniref:Uncharacterized protein n=1 Tax=Portunus trituberculatus TaxID=210409 RepID=A0A5B7DIX9_PORTR|nr:hypothetical protein [Portunus trituberculatus]
MCKIKLAASPRQRLVTCSESEARQPPPAVLIAPQDRRNDHKNLCMDPYVSIRVRGDERQQL